MTTLRLGDSLPRLRAGFEENSSAVCMCVFVCSKRSIAVAHTPQPFFVVFSLGGSSHMKRSASSSLELMELLSLRLDSVQRKARRVKQELEEQQAAASRASEVIEVTRGVQDMLCDEKRHVDTRVKDLAARLEKLVDPHDRLVVIKDRWAALRAVAPNPELLKPLPAPSPERLEALDVVAHVLAALPRVIRDVSERAKENTQK